MKQEFLSTLEPRIKSLVGFTTTTGHQIVTSLLNHHTSNGVTSLDSLKDDLLEAKRVINEMLKAIK